MLHMFVDAFEHQQSRRHPVVTLTERRYNIDKHDDQLHLQQLLIKHSMHTNSDLLCTHSRSGAGFDTCVHMVMCQILTHLT